MSFDPKALNPDNVPFILLSGGVDSTALLAKLVNDKRRPRGIFIDVGQRSALQQLETVKRLSLRYNVAVDTPKIDLVDLFRPIIRSPHPMLTEANMPDVLKPQEPVASAALLNIAAFYAALSGAEILYYPATSEDKTVVPRLRDIADLVAQIVRLNTGVADFEIKMPFLGKSHSEVFHILQQYDPAAETWSCLWGGPQHCGKCGGCQIRKQRFIASNAADPTSYSMDYVS